MRPAKPKSLLQLCCSCQHQSDHICTIQISLGIVAEHGTVAVAANGVVAAVAAVTAVTAVAAVAPTPTALVLIRFQAILQKLPEIC